MIVIGDIPHAAIFGVFSLFYVVFFLRDLVRSVIRRR